MDRPELILRYRLLLSSKVQFSLGQGQVPAAADVLKSFTSVSIIFQIHYSVLGIGWISIIIFYGISLLAIAALGLTLWYLVHALFSKHLLSGKWAMSHVLPFVASHDFTRQRWCNHREAQGAMTLSLFQQVKAPKLAISIMCTHYKACRERLHEQVLRVAAVLLVGIMSGWYLNSSLHLQIPRV